MWGRTPRENLSQLSVTRTGAVGLPEAEKLGRRGWGRMTALSGDSALSARVHSQDIVVSPVL